MSAHNHIVERDVAWADPISDPGTAGTIDVTASGICELVTATSEARTLPRPLFLGQHIFLTHMTDEGDCTIAVTGGYDAAGHTSIVFSDAGDVAELYAIHVGSTLRWQVLSNRGWSPLSGKSGLWANAPAPAVDPSLTVEVFDDFHRGGISATAPLPLWDIITGAGGTNIFRTDVLGGVLNIVSAGTDNDYHAIATPGTPFDLLNAKKLWFEARFRLSEATTNQSSWWFGLTSSLTTGGMQADASGPLGTYDGVLIWKTEGLMTVLSETSNASSQATNTTMGTFVTNTWTRVGFYVDATATTATVTFYTDLDGAGPMTAFGTTKTLTRSGLVPMHLVGGLKAGPSAGAETLQIDYMKCLQIR